MFKLKTLIIIAVTVVVVLLVINFLDGSTSTLFLNHATTGTVTYNHASNGISFTDDLLPQEVSLIKEVVNGKTQKSMLESGVPSCGFSKDISFTVNGILYALALDECGVLLNYSNMRYIEISAEERASLEAIFTSRGGKFPAN